MSSTTQKLMETGLATEALHQWPWLKTNVHYESSIGFHAYGVADTSVRDKPADIDVYSFAIPPKKMIFPHLEGRIICFGHKPSRHLTFGPTPKGFEQYQ